MRVAWFSPLPPVRSGIAAYAIAGLGLTILYLWPMRRDLIRIARLVGVHGPLVAAELRDEHPSARIETIRMGVAAALPDSNSLANIRSALGLPADAVVFA